MGKGLDRSVYLGGLTKLATGTRLTFCSAQPANFAGIAAVLLASKAISAASGALVDSTPNGAYTVAPDTTGYKLTVAAQTGMTPVANGIAIFACIDDGSTLLSATQSGTVQQNGTAQAGGASTITLASSATATDNIYNGYGVRIISGTGAGQDRIISGYVGSTKVATVNSAWSVQPNSTSVYEIFGQAVTTSQSWNSPAFVPWSVAAPT